MMEIPPVMLPTMSTTLDPPGLKSEPASDRTACCPADHRWAAPAGDSSGAPGDRLTAHIAAIIARHSNNSRRYRTTGVGKQGEGVASDHQFIARNSSPMARNPQPKGVQALSELSDTMSGP